MEGKKHVVVPPPPLKDNGGTSIHLAAMDYTVKTIGNIFRKPLVLKKVCVPIVC